MDLQRSFRLALGMILTGAFLWACGDAGPPADYAEVIQGRRDRLDRTTREGKATPFTPVEVRRIAAGEVMTVGLCDGVVRFEPEERCQDSVMLRFTPEGFRRVGEDGGEADVRGMLPLGRFRLSLSPQGDHGRILVHDPESPSQKAFRGLRWYPPDPSYRFAVRVEPYAEEKVARMATTAGLIKTFRRYGKVTFALGGLEHALSVYLPEGADPSDPAAYFIPFRDATSGSETYVVGRYASLSEDDGRWLLDFNMAGSPNCAYNAYWNCPIPPKENWLPVAIPAGELTYDDEAHG